jgi:hypothetical protein
MSCRQGILSLSFLKCKWDGRRYCQIFLYLFHESEEEGACDLGQGKGGLQDTRQSSSAHI